MQCMYKDDHMQCMHKGEHMRGEKVFAEVRTPDAYISHIRRASQYTMASVHAHAEWELYFLLSGERRYFIRDHVVPVVAGDLVLVPSGEIHKSLQVGELAHERISVEFRREFLPSCLEANGAVSLESVFEGGFRLSLNESDQTRVRSELFRLLEVVREKSAGWEDAARIILADLLLQIARIRQLAAHTEHTSLPQPEWFPMLLRHLEAHATESISLSDAAEIVFLHPSYLSRAFRRITGMTFLDYLSNLRVREARKLLETTRLPLQQIAEACGLGDVTHFGRVFRRVTGQTPGKYRKQAF